MGSHGAQSSSSANIVMQLILQVNEGVEGLHIKLYISQDA
jgi:hypothetical protein